jgi:D-aminoacyl-tRNA deacylase
MIALIQRVCRAEVEIAGASHAKIGTGILALVCAERGDGVDEARALARKTAELRMFNDVEKRMNKSLIDLGLALLAVPQFTLAADTRHGRRPSFTGACAPDLARALFDRYVDAVREQVARVETGVFGADMQVALVNDGPVTFWLRAAPSEEPAT